MITLPPSSPKSFAASRNKFGDHFIEGVRCALHRCARGSQHRQYYETLLAFDAHGRVERTLPRDGGDGDETVAAYGRAGIDVAALANQLQMQGAKSFDDSWQELLDAIRTKSQALA